MKQGLNQVPKRFIVGVIGNEKPRESKRFGGTAQRQESDTRHVFVVTH